MSPELEEVVDRLMAMAYEDDRAKLLMTLPGIGHGVAMSLLAALGDVSRLPSCRAPAEWSESERRTLDRAEVSSFANAAHRPATKRPTRKTASWSIG